MILLIVNADISRQSLQVYDSASDHLLSQSKGYCLIVRMAESHK